MIQKILLFDDKPFMIRLLQHHLEKAGYELLQARSTSEAIDIATRENPQLMVVTEPGPATDDPETLPHLRRQFCLQLVPVIRMTDFPLAQESDLYNDAEVVLTRPFSPTRFLAEVRRLLCRANCA